MYRGSGYIKSLISLRSAALGLVKAESRRKLALSFRSVTSWPSRPLRVGIAVCIALLYLLACL